MRVFHPSAGASLCGLLAGAAVLQARLGVWDDTAAWLSALRVTLGVAWPLYVTLLFGRTVVRAIRAGRAARAGRTARAASTVAGLSPPVRYSHTGAFASDQPLSWHQVFHRCALVAGLPLARFLLDPAAGVVVAFWLVLIMACGYAYAQSAWGTRRARALWFIAPVLILPWCVPVLTIHWP